MSIPWLNNVDPSGLVQRRKLEYASRNVSAIEINGTYYGTQKPATYAKWRDETPDGFVFSAKAPRRIMASKVLAKAAAQVEDFIGGIVELGDRLGRWSGSSTAARRSTRTTSPPSSGCCRRRPADARFGTCS